MTTIRMQFANKSLNDILNVYDAARDGDFFTWLNSDYKQWKAKIDAVNAFKPGVMLHVGMNEKRDFMVVAVSADGKNALVYNMQPTNPSNWTPEIIEHYKETGNIDETLKRYLLDFISKNDKAAIGQIKYISFNSFMYDLSHKYYDVVADFNLTNLTK